MHFIDDMKRSMKLQDLQEENRKLKYELTLAKKRLTTYQEKADTCTCGACAINALTLAQANELESAIAMKLATNSRRPTYQEFAYTYGVSVATIYKYRDKVQAND